MALNFNVNNMLGIKYYPKDETSMDLDYITRVVKVKNDSCITIQKADGTREKVNPEEFIQENIAIDPDGIVTIAVVTVIDQDGKQADDVIVTFNKSLGHGEYTKDPDVVCRQSITDIYYDLFNDDINKSGLMVGMCMTPRTCPEKMDYSIMMSCDKVANGQLIRCYINDTIDDILSMANLKKPNHTLECLYLDHKKYVEKVEKVPAEISRGDISTAIDGWCKDIHTLLSVNDFQFDYDNMQDIIEIKGDFREFISPQDLMMNKDTCNLKPDVANLFSKVLHKDIKDPVSVKYDHDINLKKMNTPYFLIRDCTGTLYMVTYVSSDEVRLSDMQTPQSTIQEDYEIFEKLGIVTWKK